MREHPIERFILISSSEVYGTAEHRADGRGSPAQPALARTRARRPAATGWPTRTGARTTCRSRSSARSTTTGRTSTPRRSSRASSSRRSRDRPLTIHGERPWPAATGCTCSTRPRRSRRRARCRSSAIVGETINVATGIDESVEQIADMILDILGKPASLKRTCPTGPARSTATSGPPTRRRGCSAGARDPLRRRARAHHRAGTARIPNGGRPSWPRSRRRRPSDAPPHTRGARRRPGAAARDRCRPRAGRAHDRLRRRPRAAPTSPSRARTARACAAPPASADGLIAPGTDWPVRIAAEAAERAAASPTPSRHRSR